MVIVLEPFLSFMLSFHEHKAHNIFSMMLDQCFKCLKLITQYVRKEKVHLIVGDDDKYALLLLLVHAYKVLNLSIASEIIVVSIVNNSKSINYEVNNFKGASLYNLMQTDAKMVLLVVKDNQAIIK